MEIVTIKLQGYGCELARGVINEKDYSQVKEITNNVWVKNLHKEVKERVKLTEEVHEYGILNGDILVTVNNETVLDIPISILETHDLVTNSEYKIKKINEGVVVTTLQYYEGLISDVTFILDDVFDINKLKITKKNIIKDKGELINGLYSEIYYDGENVPLNGVTTDLRMSEMFFD